MTQNKGKSPGPNIAEMMGLEKNFKAIAINMVQRIFYSKNSENMDLICKQIGNISRER